MTTETTQWPVEAITPAEAIWLLNNLSTQSPLGVIPQGEAKRSACRVAQPPQEDYIQAPTD